MANPTNVIGQSAVAVVKPKAAIMVVAIPMRPLKILTAIMILPMVTAHSAHLPNFSVILLNLSAKLAVSSPAKPILLDHSIIPVTHPVIFSVIISLRTANPAIVFSPISIPANVSTTFVLIFAHKSRTHFNKIEILSMAVC